MALHIILVLLFQQKTHSIIHIPGKFIPTMILFLSDHVPKKEHSKLSECQHLISTKWKSSAKQDKTEESSENTDSNNDQISGEDATDDATGNNDAIQTLIQELQCLVQ